jgi:hypothetical protein
MLTYKVKFRYYPESILTVRDDGHMLLNEHPLTTDEAKRIVEHVKNGSAQAEIVKE